jgi:hypothetical protein
MGDSLPPPAEFDLVDSFARLRGTDVEIVLAEPRTDLTASGGLTVRLTQGRTPVDAPAEAADTAAGRRLTVRVPRSRLTDGTWSLAVVRPGGDVAPLAARLLVQGRRPLVLLWGAKGARTHEPPARTGARGRVVSAGSRGFDQLVGLLPPERAATARRQVQGLARKFLK